MHAPILRTLSRLAENFMDGWMDRLIELLRNAEIKFWQLSPSIVINPPPPPPLLGKKYIWRKINIPKGYKPINHIKKREILFFSYFNTNNKVILLILFLNDCF